MAQKPGLEEAFLSRQGNLQNCYRLMKNIIGNDYSTWIQASCPYFTDHGPNHIKSVINSASEMIKPTIRKSIGLNEVEMFLLLSGIVCHDAAMVYQRSGHAENAKKILEDFNNNFPNHDFIRIIKDIVAAHSGKNGLKKPKTEERISYDNQAFAVRPKLLASILRFADEISENRTRISNKVINSVPEKNKIFWQYANSISSSYPTPETNRINIVYSIDKVHVTERFESVEYHNRLDSDGKISLIEYIISRLEKINNERIYCNEYMSSIVDFKEVVAEITILDGFDRIEGLDSVSFTFRDAGIHKDGEYPNSNVYNLFFEKNESWRPDTLSIKLQ